MLEIQEKSLGERHSAVVQTLTTLAGIYEEEGKNDETKYALALPLYERAGEGFVHGFFGKIEVVQKTDERGENAATLIGVDAFDLRGEPRVHRTSIGKPVL